MVRKGESTILIDAGPDIGYQLASHRIQKINAVLLTHAHLDSAGGLLSLSDWAFSRGVVLPVFTERATFRRYGCYRNLSYRFVRHGATAKIEQLSVRFLRVRHSARPGFPTFGFRIGRLAYASDVASIPASTLKQLQGVSTFILDAASWFGQNSRGHLTPDKAVRYAQWLGLGHLILTQTGHTYPPHHEAEIFLKHYVRTRAPSLKITLAHDGLMIRMP